MLDGLLSMFGGGGGGGLVAGGPDDMPFGAFGLLNDPKQAMMLGLASGLLQAGGRSNQPVSFGQAMGAGLQNAAQFGGSVARNQMIQLQTKKMQDDMAEGARRRDAFAKLWESPSGGQYASADGAAAPQSVADRMLADMTPEQRAYIKSVGADEFNKIMATRLMPKPNDHKVFGDSTSGYFRLDANGNQIPLVAGSDKKPKLGDLRKYSAGENEISEEWDGNQWRRLGVGPRFQPDKTLVEIVDPSNQNKTIFVERAQATGQQGTKNLPGNQPFGGGTEGMSLNILNSLADGMRNGTLSERERRMYEMAYTHATQPKNHVGEDGRVYTITPNLPESLPNPFGKTAPTTTAPNPSASVAQSASPRVETLAPGVTATGDPKAKPLSIEESAKVAGIQQALGDLDVATSNLFRPDGTVNTGPLLQAQRIGPLEGAPLTPGREMRQRFQRAIEVWLRANTGAAAPEQEVARYMNMYFPSPLDSPESARQKVSALRSIMGETMGQFSAGRPQLQNGSSTGAGSSMKSRYGLE